MKGNKNYNKNFHSEIKEESETAQNIILYIYNRLKPTSVICFECENEIWLNSLKKMGCNDVVSINSCYFHKLKQPFEEDNFIYADLTKPIILEKKYDLAISLKITKDIFNDHLEEYLQNLTRASDIILFTAILSLDEGDYEKEPYPSYWVDKFEKYNYVPCDVLRWTFWNDKKIGCEYKQNIMFFCKKEKLSKLKEQFIFEKMPFDIVHPAKYQKLIEDREKVNIIIRQLNEKNEKLQKKLNEKEKYIKKLEDEVKPKVSIVVPVFNVKKYLRECLDSILSQTLYEIEVLCGDGGSNDGSLEILREYEKKDKRIKVISREGSGYGQSVNECMDIARGEYISIVESDDIIKQGMYETLYNIAKQNNLDWIKSDIYHYYSSMPEEEQFVRESITYGINFYNKVLNPQNDIRPFRTALHTWAGIYKRTFLNAYNIRHHETPGGSYQDVGFHLKTLYYAQRVYFIENPFYCWRQDNPNSSIHYDAAKLIKKSFQEWELNKQFLEMSANTNMRLWGSFNYRRYNSYIWTIEMANELKDEATKIARKELIEAYNEGKLIKDFFDEKEWKRVMDFLKIN